MRTFIFLFCTTVFSLNTDITNAQEKIKIDQDKVMTVDEVFDMIIDQTKYRFMYPEDLFKGIPNVQLKKGVLSVGKLLQKTLPKGKFNVILGVDNRITIKERSLIIQRQVTGKVTGEDGIPLAGVTVLVKGTTRGVSTDFDGQYGIVIVDDSNVLIFSSIGYATQEIAVGTQSTINVMLKEEVSQLDAIEINAGYYKTSKRQATGNISRITSKDIENQPVNNPLVAIQGQIAGLQIQQTSGTPGAGINVNIRGLNSLNNGQLLNDGETSLPNANRPFYIVDGVPFISESINSGFLPLGGGNPLVSISPSDIESIEVLKDADATAIYGSRGANGVILITTKKGETGKTNVTLDYSHGLVQVNNRVDLLNTQQYIEMRSEAFNNDVFTPNENNAPDLLLWNQNRYTDWQEELLSGTGEQTNTSASISGGNLNTNFVLRFNAIKQTNVFNYDDSAFKSGSGHLSINHNSSNGRFNVVFSSTYSSIENQQNATDITNQALTLAPNAPALFDENGNLNWENNFRNPIGFIREKYTNKTHLFNMNITPSYKIVKGLRLKTAFGFNNTQVDETQIRPLSSKPPEEQFGDNRIADSRNNTWIVEPQLDFSTSIGELGEISILLGATFQKSTIEGKTLFGREYTSDALINDIQAAGDITVPSTRFSEYKYNAVYARVNYNYDGKYVLNLTGRRDGSSRFGPGKQFGNFGALGAAWLFSEEKFFKSSSWLNLGKLRGSYGVTGNDQINDYGFLNTFRTVNAYNNTSSLELARASNPNYSWETTKKLEFALELGFFSNRLNLETSWYRNRTSDMLIGRPLPGTTGFSSLQFNLPATIENRGWEFTLNSTNISNRNLKWLTSANFTFFDNELLEFSEIEKFPGFNDTYVIGESIFGAKQFKTLGVDSQTGEYLFEDFNNDSEIDRLDRQDYVELKQDFYGGITNSLNYKGFHLNIFFQFVKQNGIAFSSEFGQPGAQSNQFIEVLDRWQNQGDNVSFKSYSVSSLGRTNYGRYRTSSDAIVDASYIRLKNLSLSWSLPSRLTDKLHLGGAKIFIQGQNLLTITPYKGLDPETRGTGLPPARIITTGLQLTF
ncbi:SusC/RagA family TonB-linked outer membrane protein [Flavivirga amylovorans]|uniref:SusC/RagA family TonB-linked outer membrane protein n=1 Tax=Flavivirga amylovorans TaxID=870486 RepID=A0ABT8X0Q3_9FLAO|nr:SusC/RagA family TonB-linked outer membrane protein [Flavivirga amylovorans]MDO5987528.1 SusC/RagA family TonB-linked outer membrane protein [Flavivirga amylovorans]